MYLVIAIILPLLYTYHPAHLYTHQLACDNSMITSPRWIQCLIPSPPLSFMSVYLYTHQQAYDNSMIISPGWIQLFFPLPTPLSFMVCSFNAKLHYMPEFAYLDSDPFNLFAPPLGGGGFPPPLARLAPPLTF